MLKFSNSVLEPLGGHETHFREFKHLEKNTHIMILGGEDEQHLLHNFLGCDPDSCAFESHRSRKPGRTLSLARMCFWEAVGRVNRDG